MQGIKGREQGRQHRRVLAEQGSSQTSRGTDTANQLTENEQKFSRQREKMWERMRKRKASAPRVVPALSAVKMRNKNPRGKTYRWRANASFVIYCIDDMTRRSVLYFLLLGKHIMIRERYPGTKQKKFWREGWSMTQRMVVRASQECGGRSIVNLEATGVSTGFIGSALIGLLILTNQMMILMDPWCS